MYPNLNAEMKRKNLKQPDISKILKINSSTTSDKITGKSDFKLKECKKIKKAFFPNLQIDYLFAIEDETKEKKEE